MEEEMYEAIGRYVAGEMEGEELRAFERELQADPDLQEKVRVFAEISASLSGRFKNEEKEKAFKDNVKHLADQHIHDHSGTSRKWYVWAAAASVLLCAVLFYRSFSPTLPTYEAYSTHEPLALASRGETDSLKVQAEDAFNNGDYITALDYFNRILAQEPDNTELLLYKGIALIETDRAAEADALLTSICTKAEVYCAKTYWLRALNALKQKDYEACQSYLKQIEASSDEYSKAQKLLNDLD